jgi:8-oxo-dGTP diphosphatase
MPNTNTNALTRNDTADGIHQQVVGAAIERAGKVLLLQRPAGDFRGGTWELPSGKVEPGEDLLTALDREVTEETGLRIAAVTGYLGAFDYLSGSGKRTRQHTWSVTVATADQVRLTEHDAYTWADLRDDDPQASEEVAALLGRLAQRGS